MSELENIKVGENVWSSDTIVLLTQEHVDYVELLRLKNKAVELRNNLRIPQDKQSLLNFIEALERYTK